jgi:hypothetical protein
LNTLVYPEADAEERAAVTRFTNSLHFPIK